MTTIKPDAPTVLLDLEQFTIRNYPENGRDVLVRTNADLRPSPDADGVDMGEVFVRIAVDENAYDKVLIDSGQSADIEILRQAVRALQQAIAAMEPYPSSHRGKCLQLGDTGRCVEQNGHDGNHRFPTEEEAKAAIMELHQAWLRRTGRQAS